MKVFVTGGTGFVGGHLVRRLLAEGHTVRCLVRPTSDAADLKAAGADLVLGDVCSPDGLVEAASGCEAAVHLAALLGLWGRSEADLRRINADGARNVARACREAGVGRFVHVSTPGVVGIRGLALATETDEMQPTGAYERTKAEAERAVREVFADGAERFVIVRPDFVYGPGDRRRLELFDRIRRGRFRYLGDGSAQVRPTYVDDVIDGLLLALTVPAAAGEVFNIAGPRLVSFREFTSGIAAALDAPAPRGVPVWLTRLAGLALGPVAWVRRRPPLVTGSRIRFLTVDHGTDIAKAERVLGFAPRVDLEEGLARTVAWYRDEGMLP